MAVRGWMTKAEMAGRMGGMAWQELHGERELRGGQKLDNGQELDKVAANFS